MEFCDLKFEADFYGLSAAVSRQLLNYESRGEVEINLRLILMVMVNW